MNKELTYIKNANDFRMFMQNHSLKYLEKYLNHLYLRPIKLIKYIVPLDKIYKEDNCLYLLAWLDKKDYNIIINFSKKDCCFKNIDEDLAFIIKYHVKSKDLAQSHNWLCFNLGREDLNITKVDDNVLKKIIKLKKSGLNSKEIAKKLAIKEIYVIWYLDEKRNKFIY